MASRVSSGAWIRPNCVGRRDSLTARLQSQRAIDRTILRLDRGYLGNDFRCAAPGGMPRHGLMHLLACFALFDNEPQLVNTVLEGFLGVTRDQVQTVARKYLRPANRAIVFRRPVNAGAKEAA